MTIIVAKEEDPSRENKRMSMYMVPLNTKGISTSRLHKIGQGTTAFCEMYIDNVECDDSCLVGECGKGFLQLMQNFEIERLLICAQALGLAEAAMEDAAKYAAQRVQFNQPIYKFQQIQQMLTDMEIKIVNMQNLLYKCAWEHDNNISIRLDSALAKRYICKVRYRGLQRRNADIRRHRLHHRDQSFSLLAGFQRLAVRGRHERGHGSYRRTPDNQEVQ